MLNAPSRAAAARLGFRFEGIFRQAAVYKQRSRDTAWFSILDREWPALKAAFERWLDASNFDAAGRQRIGLSSLTGAVLERDGPAGLEPPHRPRQRPGQSGEGFPVVFFDRHSRESGNPSAIP